MHPCFYRPLLTRFSLFQGLPGHESSGVRCTSTGTQTDRAVAVPARKTYVAILKSPGGLGSTTRSTTTSTTTRSVLAPAIMSLVQQHAAAACDTPKTIPSTPILATPPTPILATPHTQILASPPTPVLASPHTPVLTIPQTPVLATIPATLQTPVGPSSPVLSVDSTLSCEIPNFTSPLEEFQWSDFLAPSPGAVSSPDSGVDLSDSDFLSDTDAFSELIDGPLFEGNLMDTGSSSLMEGDTFFSGFL